MKLYKLTVFPHFYGLSMQNAQKEEKIFVHFAKVFSCRIFLLFRAMQGYIHIKNETAVGIELS